MECLICDLWQKLPYAKRYTTPTTVLDTEGAMVLGYWVGTRNERRPLCERHSQWVEIVDEQASKMAKAIAETAQAVQTPPTPAQPTIPVPQFQLGPNPLPNPNTAQPNVAPPPPAPAPPIPVSLPGAPPPAGVDVYQMAIDAAKEPARAALGGYNCPLCHQAVAGGEVHACPEPPPPPPQPESTS